MLDSVGRLFGWAQKYDVYKAQKEYYIKPSSAWVTIHNLKSSSDGGILDPDDRLNDVADDREQIIAIFEEQISPLPPHNGGDGTSASSVGTDSPDIFQTIEHANSSKEPCSCDVEITGNDMPLGVSTLQVRRGSEPALNRLSPVTINPDPTKRWSAAVIIDDKIQHSPKKHENVQSDDELPRERGDGSGREERSAFSRGSGRHSMLGNSTELYRWAEAADRQALKLHNRKEPLGGASPELESSEKDAILDNSDEKYTVIVLKNEVGPLGIHVVPDYDKDGRDMGLVIQGIEPGGRIDRDGRLHVADRIIDINGHSLKNVSFQKAQSIFKDALKAPEIRLHLAKGTSTASGPIVIPKKPPPVFPKPTVRKDPEVETELVEGEERGGINTKVATITPTKKLPPIIPSRNPNTALTANTRKIGKRIHIELLKGAEGLGFSVTTRDNPAGGNCPIYIKNILPKGAAIQDGKLKPGDRLLEVNGIEMTGKSQTEAVTILRNTPLGGKVSLVVSRQETDVSPTSSLSRDGEMHSERMADIPWKRKEVFTFEIPLKDIGSNGLGVSVKGKTSTTNNNTVDLGIFVKSVIEGGAAFKDGRLKKNDQLISINGVSLLRMSNTEAMETLRDAMSQRDGVNPSSITITVSRRVHTSQAGMSNEEGSARYQHSKSDSALSASTDSCSASGDNHSLTRTSNNNSSTADSSATSDNSQNTVIFMPKGPNGCKQSSNDAAFGSHVLGRNPVIDRLTSHSPDNKNSSPDIPADSYVRSNQENWHIPHSLYGATNDRTKSSTASTTLKTPSGELLLIENDLQNWPDQSKLNKTNEPPKISETGSSSLQENGGNKANTAYDSQLSLEDGGSFCRDGFGRQSMSEKRHAQLDAKNTDTYQRNKKAREEKERHKSEPDVQEKPDTKEGKKEDHISNTLIRPPAKRPHYSKANGKPVTNNGMARSNSVDSLVSLKQCNNEKHKAYTPSEKLHRNHMFFYPPCCWSCHSPDCPYHAVTTNTGEGTNSKNSEVQLGPSLGMRKSSSLESLQTMVQELQKMEETTECIPHPTVRVIRGRGCNESFRAAVDRSYEAPVAETMETLEEESESGSSSGPGVHGSSHQNLGFHSATLPANIANQDAVIDVYQSKGSKTRKKGIFKGLGSVFKFGKNKKLVQDSDTRLSKEELEQEAERLQARMAAKEEQERIQEQYKKLLEQQRHQQENYNNPNSMVLHNVQVQGGVAGSTETPTVVPCMSPSRQERMQQLRAQHQRRHQERQGLYPRDAQEEWYEQEIKEKVDKKQTPTRRPLPPIPLQQVSHNYNYQRKIYPKRYDTEAMHTRSHSFDIYKEMERPGSRMGIAADPSKYSHYMNYKEIQQHLRQIQHSQQQMKPIHQPDKYNHRQVSNKTNNYSSSSKKDRPISNYFEYEATHATKPHPQIVSEPHTNSLPRRGHGPTQQTTYHKAQLVSLYHQPQYVQYKQPGDHPNSALHHRHDYNGMVTNQLYRSNAPFPNSSGLPPGNKRDAPGSKV